VHRIEYDGNQLTNSFDAGAIGMMLENERLWFLCLRIAAAIEIDKTDDLYWCFETLTSHMVRFTPRKENQYFLANQFDLEGIMGQKLMAMAEIGDLLL